MVNESTNRHKPLRAAIIGAGNLSWSLIPALQANGLEVVQLITRTEESESGFRQLMALNIRIPS